MYPLRYMELGLMSRAASRQDRIEAEAADWLAALECGTADRQAFEQWRAGDPAHALAFVRLSQIWQDLDGLRESGLSGPPAAPTEERAPTGVDRRRSLMLGFAGLVAVGLGGLGWTAAAAAHDAETGVGERQRIVVAEGIALELNTDSHVKWRHRDGAYDIDLLRGEVSVERQPGSAPCRLHCGQSDVELAAGGRMNARLGPGGVDLAILEGGATVRNPASPAALRLPAMRKASVGGGVKPAVLAISQLEAGAVSAWQQGQVQFNGETLERAVAEYNRYLSRPLEISDPSIRGLRLGGRFSATDPDDFCRALADIYGVSARFDSDRIRLARG